MKQMTRATLDGIELEYEVRGAPGTVAGLV
jgi:hypothetical protein